MNRSSKLKYKIIIFFIFVISLTTIALANNVQESKITKNSEKIPTDTYLISGDKVDILDCSKEDGALIVVGSSINLTGSYDDDVFVFGNNVYVKGTFNANLYVVSATSSNIESSVKGKLFSVSTNSKISSTIEKDLMALCIELSTSDTNLIKRDLFAYSITETNLGGIINRNANVFSDFVSYNTKILGNSYTEANYITYKADAVFEGSVTNKALEKPDVNIAKFKTEPTFIKQQQPNFIMNVLRGTFATYITLVIIIMLCKVFFPTFLNINLKANFTKITILPLPTLLFFVILFLISVVFSTPLSIAVISVALCIFMIAPYITLVFLCEYIGFKKRYYSLLFVLSFMYSLLTSVSFISIYVTLIAYLIGIGIIAYSFLENVFKSRKLNQTRRFF